MSLPSDQTSGRSGRPRLGWHPLDPVSLIAGLLAVGLALLVLLDRDVDGRVVLPTLLVGAGLVGLVAALRRT